MKKEQEEKKEKKKKTPYAATLSNILWSIKRQRKYAPSVLFMQLIDVPINVGLAWAGVYLPALVVAEVTGKNGVAHAVRSVGMLMLAILCANVIKNITNRLMASKELPYRSKTSYELDKKSMDCFYQVYEKKEMRDLRERAEMATQMWNGVQPISDMTKHAWGFVESVLCYVLFGTVLSFVNPWLILFLTLAPAVNYFCVKAYQKWEYSHREKWTDIDRKMWYVQGRTADFAVAKDIRIYGMAGWLCEVYRSLCAERSAWDKKMIGRSYLSQLADLFIILLRDGAAYAILISMTKAGEITVDEFVLYFAAISSFATWIGNILNKWNQMHSTSLKLCDLREYLEYPDEDGDGTAKIEDFLSGAPGIVFDHVSFRYDGAQEDTLHDICLTLHPGERLAIVGLNGAGKTTLIKLLCGLYRPTAGEIRLFKEGNVSAGSISKGRNVSTDGNISKGTNVSEERNIPAEKNHTTEENSGTSIEHFHRKDYYRLFSAVFQKVNTTFYSLAEMVSGQTQEKTDLARVQECMRRAGLGAKLDSLPEGIYSKLDKQVNKDGIELSGGELQKLMLARALYKDAPVLVLDEPTAALDPIAESEIYEQYKNMTQGKSSVFISHRLASTRFCDRILYMQNGRITEEGSHDSLILAGGEYAKLYDLQSCWYRDEGKNPNGGNTAQTREGGNTVRAQEGGNIDQIQERGNTAQTQDGSYRFEGGLGEI